MAQKFYTQYDRPKKEEFLEYNSGEILVETAGYQPMKKVIEDMLRAGERLVLNKIGYDFHKPIDELEADFLDPTRSPGFDLADMPLMAEEVRKRVAYRREQLRKAKEVDNPPANKPEVSPAE